MANQRHLAILKKGVEAWNEWRKNHPRVQPDLSETDLSGLDLSRANLSGANFFGADLHGANLFETDLSGADLAGADLSRVVLHGGDLRAARLYGANLSEAILRSAKLSEADLGRANLFHTDLIEVQLDKANLVQANLSTTRLWQADLNSAEIGDTTLGGIDLSEVAGLETVKHKYPSTLGIDTIYQSKGKIPEVFLRGCGLPEDFITYIASFIAGKAIQFYSAFITYSSDDELFAKRLHADLQANKVRVWFAPEDLKIGDKFRTAIDEAIKVYDKLIVILSETSVASDWVEKEVEAAFEKERREKRTVLFPIRIDEAVTETNQAWAADIRRTRHIGDFTKWDNPFIYQDKMNRLLRDLQASEKNP